MSDTFDHEADAWGDYDRDGYSGGASYNPNYYHEWVTVKGIVKTTDEGYVIAVSVITAFIPRKLVRGVTKDRKCLFVHLGSYNKIIRRAMEQLKSVNDLPVYEEE